MINLFDNPEYYLDYINKISIPEFKRKKITGKSILVVWLTKFCTAKCQHCFSRSNMLKNDKIQEKFQLSARGIRKMLDFIMRANVSYLLVSGGGEPMINPDVVYQIVRMARANRIVIVTNGVWGKEINAAKRILEELYINYKKRNDKTEVVIRLSVDRYHLKNISIEGIVNIIRIFQLSYSAEKRFVLMLHTLCGDNTVNKITEFFPDSHFKISDTMNVSDNEEVVKIMPQNGVLNIGHYYVKVGIARLFYPDLLVDLGGNSSDFKKAIEVFDIDMAKSEFGNPSIVKNLTGEDGLDFWLDYNGNITTWGNQLEDNLYNIYTDTYEMVVNGTMSNLFSYNYLDKGFYYREKVIMHVNEKAVMRAKAVNLRNYANLILLSEYKTKLFLGVFILKEYIKEGKIEKEQVKKLPNELYDVLKWSNERIENLYNHSSYDIVAQYLQKKDKLKKIDWDILFTLLSKKQFDFSENNLAVAIQWYNKQFGANISDIEGFYNIREDSQEEFYDNIIQNLFPMKKNVVFELL